MNIIVLFLLGYLLYRFVGGFLIPLFRTSRQMRQHFQDMNRQTNGNGQSAAGADRTENPESPKQATSKVGEYIDFEEVK
jgi:hypothetical protein